MRQATRVTGILAVLLAALVPPASAGEWRASPWIGWENAAVGDIRAELKSVAEDARSDWDGLLDTWGETGTDRVTAGKSNGGLGFGGELGWMASPRLCVGVRIGHLAVNGETAGFAGTGSQNESYRESWAFDLGLTPVMGGFALEGGDPDGWSWRGSFFAGPAYADARFRQAGRYVDPILSIDKSWDGKGTLTGNAIAFELGGQVAFRVLEGFSLFAEAAYLGARIKEMKWKNGVDVDGDDVMEYSAGNILLANKNRQPLVFDFSGLALRAGVTARFGGAASSVASE